MARRYQVQVPDGSTINIEGPDDATDDELISVAQSELAKQKPGEKFAPPTVDRTPTITPDNYQKAVEARAAEMDKLNGGGEGLTALAQQGSSFGLGDEITGLGGALRNIVTAPFSKSVDFDPVGAYRLDRDAERMRLDRAQDNSPVLGTLAELVGGLGAAGPGRAIAEEVPSLLKTAGSGLKLGAVSGALGGFGSGKDTGTSIGGAILGGLTGGALGGFIPMVTTAASGALGRLNRFVGGGSTELPLEMVGNALAADRNVPAEAGASMDAAHALGVPRMLADTGDNVRALTASVSRQGGDARTIVRNAVIGRQEQQGERVRGAIERDLGAITNTPMEAQALQDAARSDAADRVTAARDALTGATGNVGPVADRLASGGTAREAFDNAYSAARARSGEAYGVPELNDPQPIQMTTEQRQGLRQAASDWFADGGGDIPSALTKIIDDATALNPTTRTLTNIDRRLADFAGSSRMSGNNADAAIAERLRGHIGDIADQSAPQAYRDALANAKSVRAEQGRLFETRDVPRAFARDRYGNPTVGDTAIPERLTRPGGAGGDTADSLIAAIGPEHAETLTRQELRRQLADMGDLTPQNVGRLLTRHNDLLQRFPAIQGDLNTLQTRAGALADAMAAHENAGRAGSTALERGGAALNMSANELEREIAGLAPEERGQFAQGYRNALAGSLDRRVDDADKVRAMLGSPQKRQALAQVFGGEEGLDRFLTTMQAEREANDTFRSVATGSQTAERVADDAKSSDQGLAETAIDAAIRGGQNGIGGALLTLLAKAKDRSQFGAGEAGNRVRQSVASLLTETDPATLRQILEDANAAIQRRGVIDRNVARGAIAGGRGLSQGLSVAAGQTNGR